MNAKAAWMLAFLASALLIFCGAALFPSSTAAALPDDASRDDSREDAQEEFDDGNYNDAYELFSRLALDKNTDPAKAGKDLIKAMQCLWNLNRNSEVDSLREKAVKVHEDHWQVLWDAAESLAHVQHYGFIVAGEFKRGSHRGGGRYVTCQERDRSLALRLMYKAMDKTEGEDDEALLSSFYIRFAELTMFFRRAGEGWRLQSLTDLSELPDYKEGYYYGGRSMAAPVDEKGNPVLYSVPDNLESAKSDGELWRFFLDKALALDQSRKNEIMMAFAGFLHSQFGVQTLSAYGSFFSRGVDEEAETGIYSLHTLEENETLARLATGIKRFTLPEEFNFVRIFREIGFGPKSNQGETALGRLAELFQNRRCYEKAAVCWEESIERYPGRYPYKIKQLDQIRNNFGTFETAAGQPAGEGAVVGYRFRNGTYVHLTARKIKIKPLLDDMKEYLESNPSKLKGNKINIGQIGHNLVRGEEDKYVGEETASWGIDLEPRKGHFDKRITITTPLQKAGAYLLTAKMEGGNTSSIILWVHDTVLVKKPLKNGTWLYVGDARTGKPVAGATVELFGYDRERVKSKLKQIFRSYDILTTNFAEYAGENGVLVLDADTMSSEYRWLITATTGGGRLAFLGFSSVWFRGGSGSVYDQAKALVITDRPVYRPGQPVRFKSWVRRAKYDLEQSSTFAGQSFLVRIQDPQGEKVFERGFTSDDFAGFADEITLSKDAALGNYGIMIFDPDGNYCYGSGTFRLEEYKKPEFEVVIEAPVEPVELGDKISAAIEAKYYFGAPVTQATVKYKVTRTRHETSWYPPARWDWFYGPGYWWFAYDYAWYPGWYSWGCCRPYCWWVQVSSEPPELVMENEVEIGEDGRIEVEIDTAFAKEVHGDTDHRYEIIAEVCDKSRRTIVGSGSIIAAREPFKVYAWVNRGYFRTGDVIKADFSAFTPDRKPVPGKGKATLFRITYDEKMTPKEDKMQSWPVETDEDGRADLKITASQAGQYRLACELTDSEGHTQEGGYIFCIHGEGIDGTGFRYNSLELVADKKEYAPGEKVELMVNTAAADSTVFLFTKPSNNVYSEPRLIRIPGKSALAEIEVEKADMPNFFVEALTISNGRVHTEVKEIVVPPEKRVLDVEATASADRYKPGENATVAIRVKDTEGKPFQGSSVISIYDKSVEYISGGSNVPEIKAFFWKWRNRHNASIEHSMAAYYMYRNIHTDPSMNNIGVFGHVVLIDEWEEGEQAELMDRVGRGFTGEGMELRRKVEQLGYVGSDTRAVNSLSESESSSAGVVLHAMYDSDEARGKGGAAAPMAEAVVRKKFADTAFWAASVLTDENGFAEVELDMPENLTAWKIKTWVMGHGTKVGEAAAEVVTAKNLLLRMQTPRFFVEKDEVVLSANVHNYLENEKEVEAVLELEGDTLELMCEADQRITVSSGGEMRVDWRVKVVREGEAIIRMKALSDEESDAMEMRFPVYVHGMEKTESFSGAIRPDESGAVIEINVPVERRINESHLEIRYSPTLAAAMVDALPYLAEYPYGCTEQTLNRFVPAVITRKVLQDMGLDLKSIQEKRTNLNAQEIGDDSERAKQWKHWDRNPVFDEALLDDMVKEGLKRLYAMQQSDGGWGWFSGWHEHSSPHTTAVVVHGLQAARKSGLAIVPRVMDSCIEWLERYRDEEITKIENAEDETRPWKYHADNLDALVYMILSEEGSSNEKMRAFLYRDRKELSLYGKALFSLALENEEEGEMLNMLVRNIEQYLVVDDENQTAWLNLAGSGRWWWWCWYGSEYETYAAYLKLLSRIDPKSERAAGLAKYLINNRKHSTHWNSTRDSALCIEALADYIRASDELEPDMTVEIFIDGYKHKEVKITGENLFFFDNKLVIRGDAVESGKHLIEFKKTGTGPLYFNAYLTYFSLEDFIKRAGLEVKVNRKYYKLVPVDKKIDTKGSRGQVVQQKVEKYKRVELENLSTLKSGDLVEIELEIDSKNDYEYVVFEDKKAAGFEPAEVRSGYTSGGLGAYVEFRDDRVCFFMQRLAHGKHSVSYRVRAEIPGSFSALPAKAFAMYAPELRGNSDEIKVKIED